jgi:hypothetical protein
MYRRTKLFSLLILSAGLSACQKSRDLFSAHADVAAEAGSQKLSAERLAQILSTGKGIKPSHETAAFVSNIWIDYALFTQAAANNKLPLDSAGISQVVWPELAELRGSHWHDTLMARRSTFSPGAADSVYKANQVRLLQHILFRVEPNAAPAVRTAARRKATSALARVKGGSDFGSLASQLSEDPGSKADRGFLPPSPKGKFVTAFDSAGWTLAPGAVSGVVETPFGYHIIKRPDQDAARERITTYLAQSAGTRLDSIYMDSLAKTKEIKVARGAAAAMRAAGEDPEDARKSNKTLVSFKGGELTVAEFLRWVQALPPQYVAQLKQADDSMLTQFAKILTQNVLLLRQADSAGIRVSAEEWQGLQARYRSQLDTLRAEMGLADGAGLDSSVAAADRSKVAEMKLDEYFDRLIAGKIRLRPIPSALATLLRERSTYRLYEAGLNGAVQLAQAATREADSAKAAAGPIKPAPGPAPIPGAGPGVGGAGKPAPAPRNQSPTAPAAPRDTARGTGTSAPKAGN